MRQLPWDVPFAKLHFDGFGITRLDLDDNMLTIRESRRLPKKEPPSPERSWRVWFGQVYGYKISNESFFDWKTWHDTVPGEKVPAYIVEGSPWRKDFWNEGSRDFPMTHFVISTGAAHFEVLADWADWEELT